MPTDLASAGVAKCAVSVSVIVHEALCPVAMEAKGTRNESPEAQCAAPTGTSIAKLVRSEEHTSELQSPMYLHPFPTRRSSDLYPLCSRDCPAGARCRRTWRRRGSQNALFR